MGFVEDHLDNGDYDLVWPADVFATEVDWLLSRDQGGWNSTMEWLLVEAFGNDGPAARIQALPVSRTDFFGTPSERGESQKSVLRELADTVSAPEYDPSPPPYYPQLSGPKNSAPSLADRAERLRHEWLGLVASYDGRGYFESRAPVGCSDDPPEPEGPYAVLPRVFTDTLGLDLSWPLRLAAVVQLQPEQFYGLVEVIHDLVARPRRREWHSFMRHYHYSAFARATGRALYRTDVERLLAAADLGLTMSTKGRLIRTVGDAHQDLIDAVLTTPTEAHDEVATAVAQFRQRGASTAELRSATVVLARVLEDHRELLRTELLSADENDLFHIANKFDVRHKKSNQQADYDDAFREWTFWWYLSTINLVNVLLARQGDQTAQREQR